jgi:hypothetical protein
MEPISKTYRLACREISLPAEEKSLFMRLLREISVNAARSRKDWTKKEDFVTLWWMSIGRFPSLCHHPIGGTIMIWVSKHLPFELTESERQFLVN